MPERQMLCSREPLCVCVYVCVGIVQVCDGTRLDGEARNRSMGICFRIAAEIVFGRAKCVFMCGENTTAYRVMEYYYNIMCETVSGDVCFPCALLMCVWMYWYIHHLIIICNCTAASTYKVHCYYCKHSIIIHRTRRTNRYFHIAEQIPM